MYDAPFRMAFPEQETRPSLAHYPQRVMDLNDLAVDTWRATPDWLERSNRFTAGEKRCYTVIYGEIFKRRVRSVALSQEWLAEKLAITVRTVRRQIASLREAGVIGVYDNRNASLPNEYFLLHNDLRSKAPTRAEIEAQNACPEGTEQMPPSGHPRPLVTPDHRTSASSSWKKSKNQKKKILQSPSEIVAEGSRCSPPFPQAKEKTRGPEHRLKENSSARDASRQLTCEVEADMKRKEFEDDVVYVSRADQARASVASATKQAEASVSHDLEKKAQKRSERISRKGAAGKWGEGILSLESKWCSVVAEHTGLDPIGWGPKERRMAGDLLKRDRIDFEMLCDAIEFSVQNWDRLFVHLVGSKRSPEAPSWDFFYNFAGKILLISKEWAKHKETWRRIRKWKAEADDYDIMPNDLCKLQDKANEDLAKAKFKI